MLALSIVLKYSLHYYLDKIRYCFPSPSLTSLSVSYLLPTLYIIILNFRFNVLNIFSLKPFGHMPKELEWDIETFIGKLKNEIKVEKRQIWRNFDEKIFLSSNSWFYFSLSEHHFKLEGHSCPVMFFHNEILAISCVVPNPLFSVV